MGHHADYEAEHTPEAIRKRIESNHSQDYLKDSIYGAIDGAVTTFAVVSSVTGAGLSSGIVIILGLANLLADGFSMAAGNFVGTRAENQSQRKARREEEAEIESNPAGEKEEIRQIYAAKGFEGKTLETIVEVITSDKKRWLDTMMQEEHGVSGHNPSALKAGLATFSAFLIIGGIPLVAYALRPHRSFNNRRPVCTLLCPHGNRFLLHRRLKEQICRATLDPQWGRNPRNRNPCSARSLRNRITPPPLRGGSVNAPFYRLFQMPIQLQDFAKQVLFGETLEEKLSFPRSEIIDSLPGSPIKTPRKLSRPQHLRLHEDGVKANHPSNAKLVNERERGRLLHFFGNHELLATELMALVLLKFPEAPASFRLGVLETLKEEQIHTQLYIHRMKQCGVEFGELP